MPKANQAEHTDRCGAKFKDGKRCSTVVKRYGARCDKHKYSW